MAKFIAIQYEDHKSENVVFVSNLCTTLTALYDHFGDQFSSTIGYETANRKTNYTRKDETGNLYLRRLNWAIVRFERVLKADPSERD